MKLEDLHFDISNKLVDEKNWDIEKWQKESPMDYLKAIYVLLLSNNNFERDEVFKNIVLIAKKHVPKTLYKYYSLTSDESLNVKKFNTLNNGEVYMSDIKDFNDPFDSKSFYYNPNQLLDIEWLKKYNGKLIDDFTLYLKSTCFTSNGVQSMPMWAYYGSNHTGFCVAYDMEDNLQLKSLTFPVQYTNERIDITKLMRRQAEQLVNAYEQNRITGENKIILNDLSMIYVSTLLSNIKHQSWKYEQEFRCTAASNARGMPYVNAKPKAIYIGMKCNKLHEQRLKEIAYSWNIQIYKMDLDELGEKFELVEYEI